ncbi:hypothetical protein EGW08_004249 [Elysia chlorotica]|uniref:C2H2-type domain-containing protein n=1 Tax=Elysia chlorotica TaxID=188477 RepID=A0A3S0ZWT9_ELYCH|nr:hypothetical protein EGW08_004249 [Elysia chlorotica]
MSAHTSDFPDKQVGSALPRTAWEGELLVQPPSSTHHEGTKTPHLSASQDDELCAVPLSSSADVILDPPCVSVCQAPGERTQVQPVAACDKAGKTGVLQVEDSVSDGLKLNTIDALLSKSKKSSKKKTEIPMDDASCAQRLTQYALTIDDVIANFVYVHEPLEEIWLTEEEELALRDQFDEIEEPCSASRKDLKLSESSSTQGVHLNLISPTVQSAETQTTIYPAKNSSSEPNRDLQDDGCRPNQTSSNIDSVLAAVASDVSKPVAKTNGDVSLENKVKKKKKKTVPKKEAETEGDGSSLLSEKPGSKAEELRVGQEGLDSSRPLKNAASLRDEQSVTKSSKPKKAKKRKSGDKNSDVEKSLTGKERLLGSPSKKKKVTKKSKTVEGVDGRPKLHVVPLANSSSGLTPRSMEVGKDFLTAGKSTETSDIGESIASTSGGSEQDTPIHESELISTKLGEAPGKNLVDKDKDSPDTGLESSGGEDSHNKPVRRYKKRLDFVKCDQCEHQARGRSALSRHMKKVHQVEVDMPHKCPHCSYGCSKQASLNRHLFTHGVFSCSRCSFVAETRLALSQHVLENHRDKLDLKLCKICNRYIKCDQVSIEEHTSKCQGPTPYKCTVCEKVFKYGSSLRVHYHTHFPDQPKKFKCELCQYRTNYKANLHKHHKNMHAVKGKEFQCPDCGKLFATEDNMRRHRKVHTLARPFACETCKKTFKTSGALKGHQLIHTATRPYTCTITGCNRSFRTPKFLKSHQEEFHRLVPKKFFCSVDGCNWSPEGPPADPHCDASLHLHHHRLQPQLPNSKVPQEPPGGVPPPRERNFHCTWPGCSKSFRHSDNLKVHFRSHTTEKVFQCHLCEFKTKQKNSMFWHKKKVHQIVESCKGSGGAPSAGSLKPKSSGIDAVCGQTDEDTGPGPELADSGCQTALAMSEHSEDGSLLEGQANVADAMVCPVGMHSDSLAEVESRKAEGGEGTSARGSRDLYEFKSDDESEEDAPGSFRRDLTAKEPLAPLPPAPRELLIQNELEEQRERARRLRDLQRELDRREKLKKRQQEKKERAEQREFEKKEKIEKKEIEKKEKIEKKELEKKEKIEKKELEKKEKEEKKKLEIKERIEKKEIEKKEKIEQRELERKEKAEKKEQERKERLEKKELEMKEKEEKKEKEKQEKEEARLEREKAKKEKEEERKAKELLKLEKEKEREQKKAEKEISEKEIKEEKENTGVGAKRRIKLVNKAQKKSSENAKDQSGAVATEATSKVRKHRPPETAASRKSPARGVSKKTKVLARKKSPRRLSLRDKEEGEVKEEERRKDKPKRGRKKKLLETPDMTKAVATRKKKLNEEVEPEVSPLKKKRTGKKLTEDVNPSTPCPRSPRSSPRAAVMGRRSQTIGHRKKAGLSPGKKGKGLQVARKTSARLQARAQSVPVKKVKGVRGRRGAKPGPKKKMIEKKDPLAEEASAHEEEEEEKENISVEKEEDVNTKSAAEKNAEKAKKSKVALIKKKEASKKKVETKKISTRQRTAAEASKDSSKAESAQEGTNVPERPVSPAYSEELMLQGNASPYRDFSDADNVDEDQEVEREHSEKGKEGEASSSGSPASDSEVVSQDGGVDHCSHDGDLADKGKLEECVSEKDNALPCSPKNTEAPKKDENSGACHNEDAYSSDDDVSNDIPLTPPRAPAPPPRESSDDEMEEAGDPDTSAPFSVPGPTTPFSVPGPNTPFSVPGPNTPFSVPGPHTPFSVPPPTNLMQQQHSVPSEDTPLSTVPSVQSTEMHSHSSVELQHSLGSVEMHQPQGSVEMHHQNGSVEMHQPQGSVEMHQQNGSVEMHQPQGSVEMHQPQGSVEMHQSQGSVEMHQPHGSVEMHQPQSSVEMHQPHGSVEMHQQNGSVEMHQSQGSVEMHQPHGSVEMHQPQSSVEMHQPHGSVEMHQPQSSVEMHQSQGSVEMHPSQSATDMHSHNASGEINHNSVDFEINSSSREMHSRLSGEMHSHGSAKGNHPQAAVQMQTQGGSVDVHSHRPLGMYPPECGQMRQEGSYDPHSEASTLQKLRDEAMNCVKSSEEAVSDKYQFPQHLVESLGKYNFPHPTLPEHSHSHSDADKAYFDQYLKSLSSARGGLGSGLGSSPTGLQQLEAMVGKSALDAGPKSPSLDSSQPHDVLYPGRDTQSAALPRLAERLGSTATPAPPPGAPTPAFEAFSHLPPLHHAAPPSAPVPGRDNAYLRQDNLFPTPPVSSSFMAEAMFQRQAMSTPFLPPQAGERSSVLTSHSSSSSLLRRAGTMPTSDMFSASQAMQPTMPRNPFTNAWASQDSRASHWQTPYLPRQTNMATPGTFFPGKESYLTGREFMFDPTSVRASAEGRPMFPSLSAGSQSQESLPLDRFDLSNYFPNAAAMAPYGSSAAAASLDYTRSGHSSAAKPFDDRYRQASVSGGGTSSGIPDFRSLPAVSGSGSDMFPGIPGVNPGFNLYAAAGNPMSYHHHPHAHAQHPHHHQLADSGVNSAFLSHHPHHPHPGSAQHAAMFERDYRGLYPQNAAAAYPFINDRQSKLAHTHPSVGPTASASARATAGTEGQMQDPYRTMLYRY